MSGHHLRVSVVIPAYNESTNIVPVLDRLLESVNLPCEVLVVVDMPEDTTIPVIEEYALKAPDGARGDQRLRTRPGVRDPIRHPRAPRRRWSS